MFNLVCNYREKPRIRFAYETNRDQKRRPVPRVGSNEQLAILRQCTETFQKAICQYFIPVKPFDFKPVKPLTDEFYKRSHPVTVR